MDVVGEGAGLPTEVDVVEELGADAYVYGSAEVGGERRPIIARVDGRTPPAKGEVLHLAPQPGHMHLFARRQRASASSSGGLSDRAAHARPG